MKSFNILKPRAGLYSARSRFASQNAKKLKAKDFFGHGFREGKNVGCGPDKFCIILWCSLLATIQEARSAQFAEAVL